MSIALVSGQIKKGSATGVSPNPALPAAPTVGNFMIAQIVWRTNATLTIPSGWDLIGTADATPAYNEKMAFIKRVVQSGDSGAVTLTLSASSSYAWCIRELSGVDTTNPINKSAFGASSTQTPSITIGTPSVLNCYPISAFGNSASNTATPETNWTEDAFATTGGVFIETQHGPITTDTTTAIVASVTWGSAAYSVYGGVLLAPTQTSLSVSPSTLTFASPTASAQTSTISGGTASYTASSSNTAIATVSVSGTTVTVTPVAAGSCTITVTDANSNTTTISVTVNAASNSIKRVTGQLATGNSASASTVTPTLPSAPTPGNYMLVTVAWKSTATLTTPAGWTLIGTADYTPTFNLKMAFLRRVVQTGDGTSVSVTISAASIIGWTIQELSGVNPTTPENQSAFNTQDLQNCVSSSVTPSILSCYPIAAFANTGSHTTSGFNTGWTEDAIITANAYIDLQHGPLTTDTTTAIQGKVTWGAAEFTVGGIILLAPGAALSASPTSLNFASPAAANQTITASGGNAPYSASSSNTAIATVSVSGSTVTVTPHGVGSCNVTVSDSNSASVIVPVTVYGAIAVTPNGTLVEPYNAGAIQFSVTKTNFTGSITATSSNPAVATIVGGGNGPTVGFQALRQTINGGTTTLTFTAAGQDSTTVTLEFYGQILVVAETPAFQTSPGSVTVSEVNYGSAFTASIADATLATLVSSSVTPGTNGGNAVFQFNAVSGASGQTTLTITDVNGQSINVTINVTGNLIVTPTSITHTGATIQDTLTATEAYDPNDITATSNNTGICTVTQTTNDEGNAVWVVNPIAPGSTTITVSDGHGGTQTVNVSYSAALVVSPASINIQGIGTPNQVTLTASKVGYNGAITGYVGDNTVISASPSGGTGPTINFTIVPTHFGSTSVTVSTAAGETVTVLVNVVNNVITPLTTITQLFKSPGLNGTAGTPNFLIQLDNILKKVAINIQKMGGLGPATFELYAQYEDIFDIVAGDLIYFACFGGMLHSTVAAGANTILVDFLNFDDGTNSGQTILNINAGENILISDGVNTEIFTVQSIAGSAPWTLTLAACNPQNTSTLLNNFGLNTKVARLLYTGVVQRRTRTVQLSGSFTVEAVGLASRYSNMLANANIIQQDGANAIYWLMQSYGGTLPLVAINSANFAGPNGILVTEQVTESSVMTIVRDILTQEASHTAGQDWTFYVDETQQAHHVLVNTNPAAPDFTIDLVNVNPTGDIIGDHSVTDMDISQMINIAIVYGGSKADGTQVRVIVRDDDSIAEWGFYEGTLQVANVVDDNGAATWGAGQMQILAYPTTTAQLTLTQTLCRIRPWHMVKVTGFNNNTTESYNATTIQYVIDAKKQVAQATLNLGQAMPNLLSVMSEVAHQRALRVFNAGPSPALMNGTFVVDGFSIRWNLASAPFDFTISPGYLVYNGLDPIYVGTRTFTIPANSIIEIGVQAAGTSLDGSTLPSVMEMPNYTGMTRMYANQVFSVKRGENGNPITITQETNFQGQALWRVQSGANGIIGCTDLRATGGVGQNNRKILTAGQAPYIASWSPQFFTEGPANCTIEITGTLGGLSLDDTVQSITVAFSIAGSNNWSQQITASYNPQSLSFTAFIRGVAVVQSYDIAVWIQDQANGFTGPLMLGSSPTISSTQIQVSLNLDQVGDGTTYVRMPGNNMDGNRRALVDFSQGGHVGQFQTAAWFLDQQSMVPVVATFAISCQGTNPSSGSPYIYYSWPSWQWLTADGSTATYATGFSATTTTDYLNNAIVAGSYYVTAAYNWGTNGNVTSFFSNQPISLSAGTQFIGNGKMTLVVNQGPITVPSSAGTSGSTYSPPKPQCPAAHQPIETRNRGVVKAGQLRPGDYIRGFGDCWVKVTKNEIGRSELLRIIIDNRAYDVEKTHCWLSEIGWWPSEWLKVGDRLVNWNPRKPWIYIDRLISLGVGDYAKLEVEGHLFRFNTEDPAVGHNLTYQTQ